MKHILLFSFSRSLSLYPAAPAAFTQQVGPLAFSELGIQQTQALPPVLQALNHRPWDPALEAFLRESLLPSLTPSLVAAIVRTVPNCKAALKFFIWAGEQIGFPVLSSPASIQIKKLWSHQPHMDRFLVVLYRSCGRSRCSLSPSQINILIQGYGWAGMMDKAKDLLGQFDGFSNVKLVNSLLRALYMDFKFDTMLLVYRKMVDNGCTPDSYTFATMISVMRLLWKRERNDLAKPLLEEILATKVVLDAKTLNSVLSIVCEAKELATAEKFFRRMQSLGSEPDVTSYNILLHGMCNNGRPEKACCLFEEMIASSSVIPDTCTYVTLINGLCDVGDVEGALRILQKLGNIASSRSLYTYGTYLKCLCVSGKCAEAYEVLSQMDSQGCSPNLVIYGMLIDAFCKFWRTGLAYEVWNRMIKTVVPDLHCCRTLMSALCTEGRMLDAKQVVTDMLDLGRSPDVYCCCKLIDGYLSSNKLEEVKELISELVNKCSGNNTNVLTHLSHALAKSGKTFLVNKLFEQMDKVGVTPDQQFWTETVDGFFRSGNLESVMQYIAEVHWKGSSSSMIAHEVFLARLCKAWKLKEASKFVNEMVNNGCKPSLNLWNTLIDAFCKAGQTEDAVKLFLKMRLCGCLPEKLTYSTIIGSLCRQGDVAEARKFVDDMKKDGFDPDAGHCALIEALTGEGKFVETLGMGSLMVSDSCFPHVKISADVFKGLCSANRLDDAVRLLEEMCTSGSFPDGGMYDPVLTALFKAGREEEAMKLVNKMAAGGCKFTDTTRSIVCNGLLIAGKAEMASGFLNLLEHRQMGHRV